MPRTAHASSSSYAYAYAYCRYGAPYTVTLVCDWPMPAAADNPAPIDKRGWCILERRLSSVRKYGSCCLALSQMPEGEVYWFDLVMKCQVGRFPPLAPAAFEAMLREGMEREAAAAGSGFRFTNGALRTHVGSERGVPLELPAGLRVHVYMLHAHTYGGPL